MPAENRVRGDQRRHLRQDPTAEPLAEDRQAAPFVIRQPQSPTVQLRLQNPVLLSEVLDGLVLLALHQPDQSRPYQLRRDHVTSLCQPTAGDVFGHYAPQIAA